MNTETVTCQECSATFEWKPQIPPTSPYFDILRPKHCEKCTAIAAVMLAEERREAKREAEEKLRQDKIKSSNDRIWNNVPPIFQKTDLKHERFYTDGWNKVQDWQPTPEKPWLGLIGETGMCKSRIAYRRSVEIGREIIEQRFTTYVHCRTPSVRFASSYEITETVMSQFGRFSDHASTSDDDPAISARCWLDDIRTADFLLIDDIGKGRLSPAVAAELFALVDHRYNYELPTIWTANSTPEQIAANLPDDMREPFAGRLNDSSRIIRFK